MYKHFSFVLNYKLQHARITVLESFQQFIIFYIYSLLSFIKYISTIFGKVLITMFSRLSMGFSTSVRAKLKDYSINMDGNIMDLDER